MDKTKILIANGNLMKVESIAVCPPWSILQYFWPALRENWSWKPNFGLFESGRLINILLHVKAGHQLSSPLNNLKIKFHILYIHMVVYI